MTRMTSSRQLVFVHIGLSKTGTTYLQNRLWRNRDAALRAANLLVPGVSLEDHFHAAVHLQPDRYQAWFDPSDAGTWERLVAQCRQWPGRSIISHELMSTSGYHEAARTLADLDFAEVHVVVTIRDLARQLPSVWQENVKNQYSTPFPDFLAAARSDDPDPALGPFWEFQDYTRILDTWSRTLPPEQVHVVTVPPTSSSATLWDRFTDAIGVDGTTMPHTVVPDNLSLSALEVEMVRQLNTRLQAGEIQWDRYERLVKDRLVGKVLLPRRGGPPQQLPADEVTWVAERAEQMVSEIAAAGYRVHGDLDDLRVVSAPRTAGPAATETEVTDSALIEVALEALAGVIKTVPLPEPPEEPVSRLTRISSAARETQRTVLGRVRRSR